MFRDHEYLRIKSTIKKQKNHKFKQKHRNKKKKSFQIINPEMCITNWSIEVRLEVKLNSVITLKTQESALVFNLAKLYFIKSKPHSVHSHFNDLK